MPDSTIDFDPRVTGHDGLCDHDGGCSRTATSAVLSAAAPPCWCGSAGPCACDHGGAASLAFLCDGHAADEPVALREHAEHQGRGRGPAQPAWDALLAAWPAPLVLRAATDERNTRS
jgi:hypothetical protein